MKITPGRLLGLTGGEVGYISVAPGFIPHEGYARGVFHLSLRLTTFGGCPGNLVYHMHKNCHQTSNIRLKQ